MLTLDKIYHAAFVLKDVARKTDLIEAPKLSKDCQLYLKTENLQATGSFKVRGAYYKISQLSEEESAKGVIACSAGNHAQGVALAATRRGIKSIVCMPDGAPIMKVENTKNLGAEVCLVPGTYDDAHDKAVELQEETGMTFIHPYDDEQVIAGQGTIGLEILDQLPDVDAVVVPVGGGVGALAKVAKQACTGCKVDHAALGLGQIGIAGLHIVKCSVQAGIKGQIKLLGGVLCQRHAGSGCLCVVHQHLNATKGIHSLIDDILHGGFVVGACTHICLHRQNADAILGFQLVFCLFQFFHITASDDQICALFCKGGGNAIANGAAAAIGKYGAACAGDDSGLTR